MNDYYSNNEMNVMNQDESEYYSGSYYNAAPLTRAQYFKGADFRERRMYVRLCGILLAIFIAIDFWRLKIINDDYDIENYFWTVGTCFFLAVVFEVLIQLFGFKWCAIAQLVMGVFLIFYGWSMYLSMLPVGTFLSIVFAIHVEQTNAFEKMWKKYLAVNTIQK